MLRAICGSANLQNALHDLARNYGQRAFSYAGRHVWNSRPEHLRQTTSIDLFRCSLKTFLFGQSSCSAH